MLLSDLGEREIIRRYIEPLLSTNLGNIVGDDCAVLNLNDNSYLFSTDQGPSRTFIELLGIGTPADIAHFHVTINVSDIAAMGGEPIAILLVFAAKPDDTEEYVESYFYGIRQALNEYDIGLIGGDTKQSSLHSTTITIVGRSSTSGPLLRRGSQIGDQIFITGELVGGTLRSYILAARSQSSGSAISTSIDRPKAKVAFGKSLAMSGISTACMDMSDGLLATAVQLADINNVTFRIIPDTIPCARPPDPAQEERWTNLILNVGGDFGLMFTTRPSNAAQAERMGARRIGEVVRGDGNPIDRVALDRSAIRLRTWEQFRTVDSISNEIRSLV